MIHKWIGITDQSKFTPSPSFVEGFFKIGKKVENMYLLYISMSRDMR